MSAILEISTAPSPRHRPIALWLLACCAMVFVMVVIGGVTRLTESGLSITEWRPISGILPPLSESEWRRQFELYQQIPEFQEINRAMTLGEFKEIFWWEFSHRLWGRLIGIAFALPLLWFWARGQIPRGLGPHLVAMLILGGLQGALGWFMVQSGLTERTDVSQYRLAAHLMAAFTIHGYMFWIALSLWRGGATAGAGDAIRLNPHTWLVMIMVALTIMFGAFVAGLNGGLVYNSFPLMGGRLIPGDAFSMSPPWLDPFENPVTAQLIHRWLAMATVAAILWLWWRGRRLPLMPQATRPLNLLVVMAVVQAGLGVSTLLLMAPIALAAAHQAGAVMLWTLALWSLHATR